MRKRLKIGQQVPTDSKRNPRLRAALAPIQRRVRELAKEKEATQREIAELRQLVAKQAEYLDVLAERVEVMLGREDDLRAMLLGAHEQLMNRADAIRDTLAAELHQALAVEMQRLAPQREVQERNVPDARASVPTPNQGFIPSAHSAHGSYQQLRNRVYYERLIQRIREVADTALPPEATVLVVSKGDEELLKLDARRGWHFPQTEEGTYAGYHPAGSAEAIAHLEKLRAKGAEFLLFPETAFWWFEYYEEFKQHLDSRYRSIRSGEACVIYELAKPQVEGAGAR